MPTELLCASCRTLLRGESECQGNESEGIYIHHPNAESLRYALELPRAMCARLWFGCGECKVGCEDSLEIAPTTYTRDCGIFRIGRTGFSAYVSHTPLTSQFTFYCGRRHASLEFIPLEPDSPSEPSSPPVNALANSTGSDSSIEFLTAQYRRCRDTHTARQVTKQENGFMPSRVVDVGTDENSHVRLCEDNDVVKTLPYITLSHCWGTFQPFTLTRESVSLLKEGIAIAQLSKTFQDAISVTRRMKFRYIWIDSICIYQDDLSDWQIQAAGMRDIYSQAACCIAATAAKDGDAGLFFGREPQRMTPIKVDLAWGDRKYICPGTYWCSHPYPYDDLSAINGAPLNQRTWVAQERYLSSRIMHFTRELLFWECAESMTSEISPDGIAGLDHDSGYKLEAHSLKRWIYDYRIGKKASRTGSQRVQAGEASDIVSMGHIYHAWCSFRCRYSGYQITEEKDVLIALNGVAQDVAGVMDDQLVAGLWKTRLIEDMCWAHHNLEPDDSLDLFGQTCKPSKWCAPTWSWASIRHSVIPSCPNPSTMTDMATIVSLLVGEKPSGELNHASMQLSCRLLPLQWPARLRDGPRSSANVRQHLYLPYSLWVTLDDNCISNEQRIKDLSSINAVFLRKYAPRARFSEGIIVAPHAYKDKCFERIGCFCQDTAMSVSELERLNEDYGTAQETIINLV